MKFESEQPTIAVLALRAFAEGPFVPRSIFALLGDLEVAVKLMHRASPADVGDSGNTRDLGVVHVAEASLAEQLFALVVAHGALGTYAPALTDGTDMATGARSSGPEAGSAQFSTARRLPSQTCDDD